MLAFPHRSSLFLCSLKNEDKKIIKINNAFIFDSEMKVILSKLNLFLELCQMLSIGGFYVRTYAEF